MEWLTGIVAGRVPRAEGMYGKETLGNGTERPDGRVRFGIGIDAGISTSKHVRTLKWYSTSYCYSTASDLVPHLSCELQWPCTPLSFCMLFAAATVNIFSSVNYMKSNIHHGRLTSLQQATARSSCACLLAAVSSYARRLFPHCSFRSFLMIALTDATEIPFWRAFCVLWVCGAFSWLSTSSSTCSVTLPLWMVHRRPLPGHRSKFPVLSILASNFCNSRNVHLFSRKSLIIRCAPKCLVFL